MSAHQSPITPVNMSYESPFRPVHMACESPVESLASCVTAPCPHPPSPPVLSPVSPPPCCAPLQPVFQTCGNPSPAVHRELRRRFYVPRDGLPFFTPSWEERGKVPLSEEEMATIPDDWVVVLAKRPGNDRKLEGSEEILSEMERLFGAERVKIFDGSLSILEGQS